MLSHNIKGRCWWYSSWGWTLPPIFHYILLLCSKGTVWQNGIWHGSIYEVKTCHWILPWWKKWYLLIFTDACWTFVETKQWMWAQWGGAWCVSAVVTKGEFCWCSFYERDIQALVYHWWKYIATGGGGYAENQCFAAQEFLYQIQLLCSLYLLWFPGKKNRRLYFKSNIQLQILCS